MPTSVSMGQLARASTIAEEGGAAAEGQERGQAAGLDDGDVQGDAGENAAVAPDSQHSSRSAPPRQAPGSEMNVDTTFGYGGGAMGQVSPSSDFRRGSMSPGLPPGRYVEVLRCFAHMLRDRVLF